MKHFSSPNIDEVKGRVSNMACKASNKGDWIIDSGCIKHITYLPSLLVEQEKNFFESPVVITNGESIPIKGKCDCTLPGGVKVNGVLCVLNFQCDLLSVSRISKDLQCVVTFFPKFSMM